jgi:glycine oxidase
VAANGSLRQDTVVAVEISADKIHGVQLRDGGHLAAATVVVAAGPWSSDIDGIPGELRPQVRPVKGEILRLRTRPASGALPTRTIRGVVNGHEVYLVPRADGELVVGATVDDARAVFPPIDELELVETFAAHRPGSPDNRPIVGATEVDGLVLATGHHRNGILLTPITADLVVAAVTGAKPGSELAALVAPQRFAGAPA